MEAKYCSSNSPPTRLDPKCRETTTLGSAWVGLRVCMVRDPPTQYPISVILETSRPTCNSPSCPPLNPSSRAPLRKRSCKQSINHRVAITRSIFSTAQITHPSIHQLHRHVRRSPPSRTGGAGPSPPSLRRHAVFRVRRRDRVRQRVGGGIQR